MTELRIVTRILLDREKCFQVATEDYYGKNTLQSSDTCGNTCPSCRGENSSPVRKSVLIDPIEASIFDSGPVTIGIFCAKLVGKKGSIWVAKGKSITTKHCHKLVIMMWVTRIISIHWKNNEVDKGQKSNKKDIVCSFEKKCAESTI